MPKVTIAIPTYNRKEYLKECIKSVLNQTFQDFEIIIFDNHSNYNIKKLVSQFNDKRIKLIINEENLGNRRNFRKIFNYKFNSRYIIIFHDDDTMHPHLLGKEIELLEENPDMVFVGTNMNFIKNHEKMSKFSVKTKNNIMVFNNSISFTKLLLTNFNLCFDSVMYRMNILEDVTPYDNKFFKWGDRPYLADLSKKGKVAILKDRLVNYRIHRKQDSQAESANQVDYSFNLSLFYKEKLQQPLSKKDRKLFYSFTTNNLILSGFSFSKNWREYMGFLRQAKNKDIFKLQYLNFRGVYYFFKGVKKMYFQKNK